MPFNLGWTEIVLILVVALVIFGPGKLPEVGKAMGKTLREFKLAVNKIDSDIKKEVDDIKDSVGVDDLKASVDPVNMVKEAMKETPQAKAEEAAANESGAQPASEPAAKPSQSTI